jgi:hypothetical protein
MNSQAVKMEPITQNFTVETNSGIIVFILQFLNESMFFY